ncbi:MAG TPA: carboxymuconolactone decarboxylase family protein [Polyangiaceae bacterium]|nr:carboxymuconolactone decarboxylase family protein [Polyangiaceae bacterium]
MSALETLREGIGEPFRDIKLNLQAVLSSAGVLTPAQRWGVAVASAAASRNVALRDAVIQAARQEVSETVVEDALAAAALMAMNNVFYRFRHLVGKGSYAEKPARLRMNRIGRPATNKPDFELFSLAVSAINGCGTCMQAHEQAVVGSSMTEDHVHDAVRIASVIVSGAVALELAGIPPATALAADLPASA